MSSTPRDDRFSPERWRQLNGALRDQVDRDVEFVKSQPSADANLLFFLRFDVLWSDYSAGRDLAEVKNDFQALLDEWTPHVETSGRRRALEVAVWIQALGLSPDYLEAWREGYLAARPAPEAFTAWALGTRDAWTNPAYVRGRGVRLEACELAERAELEPSLVVDDLREYARLRWYRGSKGEWFYAQHLADTLDKTGQYLGYWCWKAAAIVLRTGLDDSSFRGVNYYPFDLVHYLDDTSDPLH